MSTEIPIWVNGKIRWLSGIDKKTTCKDVVEVLLGEEGLNKSEAKDFTIMERWRKVERQLDENSKILKIWSHWGNEKKEVRLCLRRVDNEVDSGRGSPIGSGYIPSLRRKRNRIRGNGKPPWAYKETLHPRRLAELGRYDDSPLDRPKQSEPLYGILNETNVYDNKIYNDKDMYIKLRNSENTDSRKTSGHKSYHCSGTGRLHSTPFSESHSKKPKCCSKREPRQKIRSSENIEKLMKLILAQGATIQSQLQKLKEREEQIELLEQEKHRERLEKNGRNYLLETYLGSLKDAEIPEDLNDIEKENKNARKTENAERIHFDEFEIGADVSQISEKIQSVQTEENRSSLLKGQHKSARSRSESRAKDGKLEGNLKRALSCNTISEANDDCLNSSDRKEVYLQLETTNAKEDNENIIELKRIQSQIEMWEKVFKINKKLEKEEENLVRLHIKIKKIQSENYRITKEELENEKENKERSASNKSEESDLNNYDTEKMQYERDCADLVKNLETLKSDLENNSKEIYQNFTKLLEEGEIVEEKRSCLSKIIKDLEKTDHEHDMLSEMFANRENRNFQQDQVSSFCESISNFEDENPYSSRDRILPMKNNVQISAEFAGTADSVADELCSNDVDLSQIQDNLNQRTEINVCDEEMILTKPKIVKISFEDKIQNYESTETPTKMFYKDPIPVPPGALKSILKNRKNDLNKMCNLNNGFRKYQGLSQNYEVNDNVVGQKNLTMNGSYSENYHIHSQNNPNTIKSTYPYTIAYPLYSKFPDEHSHLYSGNLSKISENFKSVCLLKNPRPHEISKNSFPQNTIVTSKVLVNNDTDSSTSSDTSGLSSMYSSSTTVEDPYVEKSYVLDTLV